MDLLVAKSEGGEFESVLRTVLTPEMTEIELFIYRIVT